MDGVVDVWRSRAARSAAVAAAPVRADTLAMIAMVVFDIVDGLKMFGGSPQGMDWRSRDMNSRTGASCYRSSIDVWLGVNIACSILTRDAMAT